MNAPRFTTPPTPLDEFDRLQRIARLGLTPGQQHTPLEALMRMVGAAIEAPVAIVSIVDKDIQFFLAHHGLGVDRTPRAVSFCGHCVAARRTLRVPDAQEDARFAENPLVVGPPDIRAYLGVPLFAAQGHSPIGTVCVIDRVPRAWTDAQARQLEGLAIVVEDYLEGLAARRAWQHSPLSLVIVDHLGRCVRANPAFERLVGFPAESLFERPIASFVQPRDRNVLSAMVAHALKHRASPTRRELGFLRLTGEVVSGGTSVAPLDEPDDQVVCVIRDISLERRIVAQSEVVSEVRAELQSPMAEAARQLDALATRALSLEAVASIDAVRARLRELDALLDARLGDIAARAKMETELRASEQRLQVLVNRVLGPMFVIDDRGRIVDANPTAIAIYGWSYEELLGASLALIHPVFSEADCARWFDLAEQRARQEPFEQEAGHLPVLSFVRRDGATMLIELEPLAMEWNGPGRLVLIARDVSIVAAREDALRRERDVLESEIAETTAALHDVKRMETAVIRSLEEKDTLLKEIHHRVKNNLQMVSSLLSLQLDQMPEGRAQELLAESVARVRSMALIHQHLYGSTSLARVDLASYASSLTESLRYVLAPTASVRIDAESVEVAVESAVPIGLILNELVTNAMKYGASPTGHSIEIAIRTDRQQLRVTVRDHGRGLPEGFSLRTSTSLGLQLVTTLTAQLRGTLETRSDGGAVFALTCPLTARR